MEIRRRWLKYLFNSVDPKQILLHISQNQSSLSDPTYDSYNSINRETFFSKAPQIFPERTQDEWENLYSSLKQSVAGSTYGVFSSIFEIVDNFLVIKDNQLLCRYEHVLRWRDISFHLSQDLFTTAYLAKNDFDNNTHTHNFSWPAIIKTDNAELQNVLNKGVAENHFHLNGSTQIFILNWISVMNNIMWESKQLKELGNDGYNMYKLCQYAALIRYYLFLKTCHQELCEPYNISFNLKHPSYPPIDIDQLTELQDYISSGKHQFGCICRLGILDYAYTKEISENNNNNNRILSGERKLLYDCYSGVLRGSFSETDKNLFYTYLLLRNRFRSKLVQINGQVGFKNFDNYQNRKEIFISGEPKYEYELVRLAVNASLENQSVVSLEARICPKGDAASNHKAIQQYDEYASISDKISYQSNDQVVPTPPPELFYVLHFPKAAENKGLESSANYKRDYVVRNCVYKKTMAIIDFMLGDLYSRNRVRGIDACANEIGCRPEVFAESFRRLTDLHRNYTYARPLSETPRRLYATYHAGEDFLDIVDGLRAIDEAILFCGLDNSSRLGHALALGIDSHSYYSSKKGDLIIDCQSLLDNICWLIGKAHEYQLDIDTQLKNELTKNAERLYKKIYNSKGFNEFRVLDYFLTWKLRGDRPELYLSSNEDFENNVMGDASFLPKDQYCVNKRVDNHIRNDKHFRLQNYLYYFDFDVNLIGKELEIFKVPSQYEDIVERMQVAMQNDIAKQGIAIECNPSSNYLIGGFDRYDCLPIFKFCKCPIVSTDVNLNVSVNTDDQGVFDTMLENEYALISLALDKKKELSQQPQTVLEYIDLIRRQGLSQVFPGG